MRLLINKLAGEAGFEPALTDPKSAVLPLDDSPFFTPSKRNAQRIQSPLGIASDEILLLSTARLTKIPSTNRPEKKAPLLNTDTRQLHLGILTLYKLVYLVFNRSTDSVSETFLSDVFAGDVGTGCCRRRQRAIAGNGAIIAAGKLVEVVS